MSISSLVIWQTSFEWCCFEKGRGSASFRKPSSDKGSSLGQLPSKQNLCKVKEGKQDIAHEADLEFVTSEKEKKKVSIM